MKKIKQIVLTLLVVSFLVNPMYLILRVHAVNEEIAMSRISNTLQSVMESGSEDESIEVMIWLEDINTSSAILNSTKEIISTVNASLPSGGICEVSAMDAETHSQYKIARKDAMRSCYEEYTRNFAEALLEDDEIIYLSKYSPIIVSRLTKTRINDIVDHSCVAKVDYYCDDALEENSTLSSDNVQSRSISTPDGDYCQMDYIKSALSINSLRDYVSNKGNIGDMGIRIGVLDTGTPNESYFRDISIFTNPHQLILHHPNSDVNESSHPTAVLEILYSILPEAEYYYATYEQMKSSENNSPQVEYTMVEEIEWLLYSDVQVINISLDLQTSNTNESNDGYSSYGIISDYLDYITSDYWVLIVKSAGNGIYYQPTNTQVDTGISNGGMAYNIITVGNYNWVQQTIGSTSQRYDGNLLAYKPDICAPGYIKFVGLPNMNGTSLSAPIITALSALIFASEGSMITPYEVKSIICASANAHRYDVGTTNYRDYGAGVVDGLFIKHILADGQYVKNYFEPDEWTHTYDLDLEEDEYADIVLVFEKSYYEAIGFDIGDLDLYVYDSDGDCIDYSVSSNNNIELILEVSTETEYITIAVRQSQPVTVDDPDGTITDDVRIFYSIAWRVYS